MSVKSTVASTVWISGRRLPPGHEPLHLVEDRVRIADEGHVVLAGKLHVA